MHLALPDVTRLAAVMVPPLLGIGLKAVVLLVLAWLIHAALGSRRWQARSLLWNGVSLALLALPVTAASVRQVSLPVLPAPAPGLEHPGESLAAPSIHL